LVDSHKSLSAELLNALLRWIAPHSQVELTIKPTVEPTIESTVEPTIEPNVEPTVKTIIYIHRYTIQADCNQFDNILIDTQSELIGIDLTIMPINIQSKPITIAAITHILQLP
jgi:hypothetical protein